MYAARMTGSLHCSRLPSALLLLSTLLALLFLSDADLASKPSSTGPGILRGKQGAGCHGARPIRTLPQLRGGEGGRDATNEDALPAGDAPSSNPAHPPHATHPRAPPRHPSLERVALAEAAVAAPAVPARENTPSSAASLRHPTSEFHFAASSTSSVALAGKAAGSSPGSPPRGASSSVSVGAPAGLAGGLGPIASDGKAHPPARPSGYARGEGRSIDSVPATLAPATGLEKAGGEHRAVQEGRADRNPETLPTPCHPP
ncbi:hypothetical protein T484DRAFT_1802918 [Baffinella frigidus]|nr:hypothetical protein T484DRAFT_1802918 [Cryptophyta sp. CCMP2293]